MFQLLLRGIRLVGDFMLCFYISVFYLVGKCWFLDFDLVISFQALLHRSRRQKQTRTSDTKLKTVCTQPTVLGFVDGVAPKQNLKHTMFHIMMFKEPS